MLSGIVALSYKTGSLWSFLLLLDSHQATCTALAGKLGFCKASELTLSVPCAAKQHSAFTQHAHTAMFLYSHSRNASYCTPPPLVLLESTYSHCFIPDCCALGCCQGTPDPSNSWLLQECRCWLWDQAFLPALSQHTASSETQRKVGLQPRVPCSAVRVTNHRLTAKISKSSRNKQIVRGTLLECSSRREDNRIGSSFRGTQCSKGGTNSACLGRGGWSRDGCEGWAACQWLEVRRWEGKRQSWGGKAPAGVGDDQYSLPSMKRPPPSSEIYKAKWETGVMVDQRCHSFCVKCGKCFYFSLWGQWQLCFTSDVSKK